MSYSDTTPITPGTGPGAPGSSVAVPATSTSPGLVGEVAYAPNAIYVCTAPNKWIKLSEGVAALTGPGTWL